MFKGLLATHPPLHERIRRLEPGYKGEPSGAGDTTAAGSADAAMGFAGASAGATATSPQGFSASVGQITDAHVAYARALMARLPEALAADCRTPEGAEAVVCALFVDADTALAGRQLGELERRHGRSVRNLVREHADWLNRAGPEVRLPVADLAQAGLRGLDDERRALLTGTVDALVQANGRISLMEYALRRILLNWRWADSRAAGRSVPVAQLRENIQVLLSFMAYAGSGSKTAADAAFEAAVVSAPLDAIGGILPKSELYLKRLDRALTTLSRLQPRFRKGLVEACAACIIHDRRIRPSEGELLRAVCDALECPMPPLLPGQFRFVEGDG